MATYLLLRDNKQIGPLSLEEITQKGFKAYDLVWVEGKSAAWRYPSEIQELKSFAPVVEEQPFDRFYKRPSAETKTAAIIEKAAPEVKLEPVVSIPEKQYAAISRGDNKVYVTLPARHSSTVIMPSSNKNIPSQAPSTSDIEELKKSIPQQRIFSDENFVKHTGFDNDFPHQNVVERNQPVEKKQQRDLGSTKNILKPALMIAGVIILLGSGILIGLYINKNTYATPQNTMAKQQAVVPVQKTNQTAVPVSEKLVDNNTPNSNLNNQNSVAQQSTPENGLKQTETLDKSLVPVNSTPTPNKKEETLGEKNSTLQKTKNLVPKKIPVIPENSATSADSDFSAKSGIARRNATHRTDEISDKTVLKANIADLVGLTASNYTVGTFGGISNLQITVSNRSVYPLDLVVVEVQYIQANKKIFKTENLYFHNVTPGSALMEEAPKSPRGIKVQYKIALINSKESGISYSGN